MCGGGYVGKWGGDVWRWVCEEVGWMLALCVSVVSIPV